MTPEVFYETVLTRGLDKAAGFAPELGMTRGLSVLMTTIAGVESNWEDLVQIRGGEAHGLFQQEEGDIALVIKNPASEHLFDLGMDDYGINTRTAEHLWDILATPEGMNLSVFLARLNLWCNPNPLPAFDEEGPMFQYYLDTWRPSLPSYTRWQHCYGLALSAVPAE